MSGDSLRHIADYAANTVEMKHGNLLSRHYYVSPQQLVRFPRLEVSTRINSSIRIDAINYLH